MKVKNLAALVTFVVALTLCLACMGVFSPVSYAQSTYGTISGSVVDSSGAAIADAQVTLTNLGTSEKRTQSTGSDGLYSFVNLNPGRYKIEAEKTGFKHFTRPEVVVEVNQSAEYLDGQPLNIGYINLPLIIPTQDSIGEFKVQYNNLGPEWGKFSGGIINLSTQSGSNEWHGTAYEYLRNKVLNANQFFANAAGIPRSPFTQNQYGATLGGPAVKEKLFFFFSWETFALRQGTVFTTTVPTLAERGAGASGNLDFSALCVSGFTGGICNDKDAQGRTIHQIYNPLSVNTSTGVRQPFAGNVIPANLLNQTSKFLLGLFPNPTNTLTKNNFVKATGLGGNSDEYIPRVDYQINNKSHIFGRYSYWKLADLPRDPFGTGLCQDRCAETYHTNALAIGYTYTVNPTTTADLNVSASRFRYLRVPVNAGFDVTKELFPAAYNPAVPSIERTPLTPCLGISDSLIGCSQGQSAISDKDTQYNFLPRVTVIRGRHTFVAGGQFEFSYDNYLQTNTGGGLISLNGFWTQDNARGAPSSSPGSDVADFLLGFGLGQGSPLGNQTSGAVNISGPVAGKQFYRGFYGGGTLEVNQ